MDEIFAQRQAEAKQKVSEEAKKHRKKQEEAETVALTNFEQKYSILRETARKYLGKHC